MSSLGSGKLVCFPRYLIFVFLKVYSTVRNNIILGKSAPPAKKRNKTIEDAYSC